MPKNPLTWNRVLSAVHNLRNCTDPDVHVLREWLMPPTRPGVPFRFGDVVSIDGQEHLVKECLLVEGSWKYSTNRSSWHPQSVCVFVRPADADSVRELLEDLDAEHGR